MKEREKKLKENREKEAREQLMRTTKVKDIKDLDAFVHVNIICTNTSVSLD